MTSCISLTYFSKTGMSFSKYFSRTGSKNFLGKQLPVHVPSLTLPSPPPPRISYAYSLCLAWESNFCIFSKYTLCSFLKLTVKTQRKYGETVIYLEGGNVCQCMMYLCVFLVFWTKKFGPVHSLPFYKST